MDQLDHDFGSYQDDDRPHEWLQLAMLVGLQVLERKRGHTHCEPTRKVLEVHPELPLDPCLLLYVVEHHLFPHAAVGVARAGARCLTEFLVFRVRILDVARRIDAFFCGVRWICRAFRAGVEVWALAAPIAGVPVVHSTASTLAGPVAVLPGRPPVEVPARVRDVREQD